MPPLVHEILLVIAALISLILTALIALIVVVAYSCNLDRETSARRFLAFIQGYRYLGRDGVVFQRSSQCAIACYRMLLARYGIGRPKDDNLEHSLTPAGMSMLNLLKALKGSGPRCTRSSFFRIGATHDDRRSPAARRRSTVERCAVIWETPMVVCTRMGGCTSVCMEADSDEPLGMSRQL